MQPEQKSQLETSQKISLQKIFTKTNTPNFLIALVRDRIGCINVCFPLYPGVRSYRWVADEVPDNCHPRLMTGNVVVELGCDLLQLNNDKQCGD